jgi:hypothetical protein
MLTLEAHPDAPVACTIEKGGMAKRALEFRDAFGRLESSHRTTEGFSWVFRDEPGFEPVLLDLATREHTCCLFLDFVLAREKGRLVWEVRGPQEAQFAIDIFYALPETIHEDVEALKRKAERAGLPFTNDAPARSPCS